VYEPGRFGLAVRSFFIIFINDRPLPLCAPADFQSFTLLSVFVAAKTGPSGLYTTDVTTCFAAIDDMKLKARFMQEEMEHLTGVPEGCLNVAKQMPGPYGIKQ
jgi:hypothetical protein